jgi:hypothetical protein
MDTLTKKEREDLFKARFILLPPKLVRDAIQWKINIQDTVIEALHRRIHDKKKAYYMKQRVSPCD